MRLFIISVSMLLLMLSACGGKKSSSAPAGPGNNAMAAAVGQARDSLPYFFKELQAAGKNNVHFSVRVLVQDQMFSEELWLTDLVLETSNIRGRVGNKPEEVRNIDMNDIISVSTNSISDWMFVVNGTLVGGFTIRAYRASLAPADREQFDKTLDFIVD